MVRVIPFKAYRYDESKVGDLSKTVAPPYDIIKGNKVDELQSLSEYNISWIIKNKPSDGDTESNNQYTRARDHLDKWVEEGVLRRDEKDAFYVYGQDFQVLGRKMFRFGFVGLIELEEFASQSSQSSPFAGVLQHEETLPKDIQDRLSLCKASMTQFGQIFVIYPDHAGAIDSVLKAKMGEDPVADITDSEGIRHRVWKIDDESQTAKITELMKDKYIIIADGHHRYKTAIALSKDNPNLEAARYRMLTFVNVSNPGLVVLPTHRLVQNLEDFSADRLLASLNEYFEVDAFEEKEQMFNRMSERFNEGGHALGLFLDDSHFYMLDLKDAKVMDKALPERSKEHRKLDVAILHTLVLDRILGIDKEKLAQGTVKGGGFVSYIKGIGDAVDEAIRSVKESAQCVFFMNPTRIREVEEVSRNLETMPQKSTFFYPKVYTGFTINKLN